jgi:hypothetical protein
MPMSFMAPSLFISDTACRYKWTTPASTALPAPRAKAGGRDRYATAAVPG